MFDFTLVVTSSDRPLKCSDIKTSDQQSNIQVHLLRPFLFPVLIKLFKRESDLAAEGLLPMSHNGRYERVV